jgi:hypothetical protein
VQGVTFENLRINGKIITSIEEANIKVGEFTKNITFKNAQPKKEGTISAAHKK